MSDVRERVALFIAPWLFVPYRYDREEAFKDLAEVAYGRRDAVWTSPRVLVKTALREASLKSCSRCGGQGLIPGTEGEPVRCPLCKGPGGEL